MIKLNAKDVAEFRELYRKLFNIELTDDQAREYAERLVAVVAFVAGVGPLPLPPD